MTSSLQAGITDYSKFCSYKQLYAFALMLENIYMMRSVL